MCQVCTSIKVTDTFSSFVTKSAYKINHDFNCNNKYLICLLSCKIYGKQYTGKTVDKFRRRWNNYKTDARKAATGNIESYKQQSFQSYFCRMIIRNFYRMLKLHQLKKVKTQVSDPTKTKCYWMRTLKNLVFWWFESWKWLLIP